MNTLSRLALVAAGCSVGLFAADTVSKHDQQFAKEAAQGGMAEVQLGRLAVKNGSSPKVKEFGQKMVDDHSKAGDKLQSIAGKKSISLPADVTVKDKALMMRLSKLSGDAFDRAYMSAMVKDHETDVAEFEKEANNGSDSDLKDFASKTLPTLKNHLSMAKEAADSVRAMK
jgi:putative membrane protein